MTKPPSIHEPRSLTLYVEWLEVDYRSSWSSYPHRWTAIGVGRYSYGKALASRLGERARLLDFRRRKENR